MCLGIPYEIVETGFLSARAKARSGEAWINMSLVGDQPAGTHVLVFLGAAREVISSTRAAQIADALEAVRLVMLGEEADIDHLFADLVGREPQLPEHLRPAPSETERTAP